MTDSPRVLVIGLDPERVPGPWDPAPRVAEIQHGINELEHGGADVTSCLLALDGFVDAATQAQVAIKAGPWDVVVIGGGLRTSEDHLTLFEDVVNAVHAHAPDARIAFNATAGGLKEAVDRRLARTR